MLESVSNIVKSATAFLQSGTAPPNTPAELKQAMEDTNHFASKKFFIIFTAILMVLFMFFASVTILFWLPPSSVHITAYTTIFTKVIEIFSVIISVYIGAQGLVDLRYNSSSNAGLEGRTSTVDRIDTLNNNITEQCLTNNAKEADYVIHEGEIIP